VRETIVKKSGEWQASLKQIIGKGEPHSRTVVDELEKSSAALGGKLPQLDPTTEY
jgi:hypothetical protein